MYLIEKKIDMLINSIDVARNNLKEKLLKKNIVFDDNDSLRKLISLIPNNYKKPSILPYATTTHTGVSIVNNVLISGGLIPGRRGFDTTNRQEMYSIDTNTFSSRINIPYVICKHKGVNINGNVLISGGSGSTERQVMYNTESDTFTSKTNIPFKVESHSLVNINGNALISGGYIGGGAVTNRQELYNTESDTFTSKLNISNPIYEHIAVSVGENILFSGGYITDKQEVYNIVTDTLTNVHNTPYPIYKHTAVNVDENILLSGGNNTGGSNPNYILDKQILYNFNSNTFSSNSNMPYVMMTHTAAIIDKNILFSGGSTLNSTLIDNQELYLPYQDKFVL